MRVSSACARGAARRGAMTTATATATATATCPGRAPRPPRRVAASGCRRGKARGGSRLQRLSHAGTLLLLLGAAATGVRGQGTDEDATLGTFLGVEAAPDPYARQAVSAQQFEDCSTAPTLSTAVRDAPALSTLAAALAQTGINISLEGPGPVTLFAPTDAAFEQLAGSLEAGDPEAARILELPLDQLLLYHTVAGAVPVAPLAPEGVATAAYEAFDTVLGRPVELLYTRSEVRVGREGLDDAAKAAITGTQAACNGVLALIDRVLVPPPADATQPVDDALPEPVSNVPARPAAAAPACPLSECCDAQPPPNLEGLQFTCAEQVGFGACDEAWMLQGNFCRLSCGRCFRGDGGAGDDLADRLPAADGPDDPYGGFRPLPQRPEEEEDAAAEDPEVLSLEEACACTGTGLSGETFTGREGCFRYSVAATVAGRVGERTGAAVGSYLTERWGMGEGTSAFLASLYSGAARSWADENIDAERVRVCYVRGGSACPYAEPSEEFPGAFWVRCEDATRRGR